MIVNHKKLQEFERKLLKKGIMENFRIVEALYREAIALRAIPLKDPLDGLELDVKIARIVNSVSETVK
jgi:hypothetical protein